VINPNLDTISPRRLATEFGAEILITNSYIIHGDDDLRECPRGGSARPPGFPGCDHDRLRLFQLSRYGEIDVTTEEILAFQREIGSDIATPVDIPTPPDVSHERAEADLETTQERLEIAEAADTGEMLVSAPVQGSTIRTSAAGPADTPTGPILTSSGRRGRSTAERLPVRRHDRRRRRRETRARCRRAVHLFGAGHPMMFALAVAMGCDLFDSAAYALYARDDRYPTVRGTRQLADLEYLPCSCAICTEYSPDELRALPRRRTRVGTGSAQPPRHLRRNPADQGGDPRRQPARTRRAARPPTRRCSTATARCSTTPPNSSARIPVSEGSFSTPPTRARAARSRRHHERLERLSVPDSLLLTERIEATSSTIPGVGRRSGRSPSALEELPPHRGSPKRTDRAALGAAQPAPHRLVG